MVKGAWTLVKRHHGSTQRAGLFVLTWESYLILFCFPLLRSRFETQRACVLPYVFPH